MWKGSVCISQERTRFLPENWCSGWKIIALANILHNSQIKRISLKASMSELPTRTHWPWDSRIWFASQALTPHLWFLTLKYISKLKSDSWEFIYDLPIEPEESHLWSISYGPQWDCEGYTGWAGTSTRWAPAKHMTGAFHPLTSKPANTKVSRRASVLDFLHSGDLEDLCPWALDNVWWFLVWRLLWEVFRAFRERDLRSLG